jgi:hypothetical protein
MKQIIKNVVLVHGAFADGSGWEDVANILKGRDRPAVRAGGSGWPTATAGQSSLKPAIIRRFRRLSILPHSRWTMEKAAPRSSKPYRRPARGSSPTSDGYNRPLLRERALPGFSTADAPWLLARRQCDGVMCSMLLKLRVKAAWSQKPDSSATSTRDLLVRESRPLACSVRRLNEALMDRPAKTCPEAPREMTLRK